MAYFDDTPTAYRNQYVDPDPARTFVDIDMSFGRHPVSKDVLVKTNEAAIKQSLVNLVMLNFYEKPFHPSIGGNIYPMLFENFNVPGTKQRLEKIIKKVIKSNEPRVEIMSVVATIHPDKNAVSVDINFKILNTLTPSTVNIFLDIKR